ncbi:hypothetical protein D0Y65_005956 [Glycine soja]|uniref:Uncharacterized protein n=1 Tax=Glycine soja TaxID=3848 RepID=A0A445L714_GLYSO|nr:hypothetical protein D0Y65_005956 [Glycine soja]
MDYSDYSYQQQPQQHSYGYDPSQIPIQPYDQSYAAYQQYYAYNPQYAYYPNAHQTQFQFQPETAPLHPPGVNPAALEPTPSKLRPQLRSHCDRNPSCGLFFETKHTWRLLVGPLKASS